MSLADHGDRKPNLGLVVWAAIATVVVLVVFFFWTLL
jgi:uncharacterized membrane protein YjfL (UPF0719 family)